jgi:hypothetical protein
MLRKLMSMNRTSPDDAERLSHLAKILSTAASSDVSTSAFGDHLLAPSIR